MNKVFFVVTGRQVEDYLAACFGSLLSQSVPDWHCIYVDDFSQDGSPRIAREFARKHPAHFTILRNHERLFKMVSFRLGCSHVPKEGIVAELDADDRLASDSTVQDLLHLHTLFDLVWTMHITNK